MSPPSGRLRRSRRRAVAVQMPPREGEKRGRKRTKGREDEAGEERGGAGGGRSKRSKKGEEKTAKINVMASRGTLCSHRISSVGQREQSPNPQASSSSSNVADLEFETCPMIQSKGGRGPAKGVAGKGLQEGQFLDVEVQGGTGVGRYGADFVTELGIVARAHCKLWQTNWSKLPLEKREAIFRDLQSKFRFERTPKTEKEVVQHMGEMHRKYRGALKKRFFNGKSFEEAIANVPSGVDLDEWRTMCEKWSTSKEQSIAERNKANRSRLTMPYRLGRKSIYQVKDDFRRTQGRDPHRPEIFQMTRCREASDGTKIWVDEESKEKMDQIRQLMTSADEEAQSSVLTPEQAFIHVMGKDRSGRVRCAGRAETLRRWYGPSSASNSSSSYQELVEQNQVQAVKIEEQADKIRRLETSFGDIMQQLQSMQAIVASIQASRAPQAPEGEDGESEGDDDEDWDEE